MYNLRPLTVNGRAYLNLGCGTQFHPDWNHLDVIERPGVHRFDIMKGIPFPRHSFDAIYSSHVFEHLTPEAGQTLLQEIHRTLKPGGIVRIVVPDLEEICRSYLEALKDADKYPEQLVQSRHAWMTLELLDQLIRRTSGGRMKRFLSESNHDIDFIRRRIGDEYDGLVKQAPKTPSRPPFFQRIRERLTRIRENTNPQTNGEAHRWMYDRVSLSSALKEAGFASPHVTTFNQSLIPEWNRFALDTSRNGSQPRKPDSLYVEASSPTA